MRDTRTLRFANPRNLPPTVELLAVDYVAPAINDWLPAIVGLKNIRIYQLLFSMLTTGEDIEFEITIDGRIETLAFAAVANTGYQLVKSGNSAALVFWYTPYVVTVLTPFLYDCRALDARIRKVTAAGVGNLRVKLIYGQY